MSESVFVHAHVCEGANVSLSSAHTFTDKHSIHALYKHACINRYTHPTQPCSEISDGDGCVLWFLLTAAWLIYNSYNGVFFIFESRGPTVSAPPHSMAVYQLGVAERDHSAVIFSLSSL